MSAVSSFFIGSRRFTMSFNYMEGIITELLMNSFINGNGVILSDE